jgi:aerobic carbon-monoxide dehydrogenase large subunit
MGVDTDETFVRYAATHSVDGSALNRAHLFASGTIVANRYEPQCRGHRLSDRNLSAGVVGDPVVRKEDARLLIGQGRFTDDFSLPGQLYAVMVRSPHPHARIVRIDATRARAVAGVLAVFTGADCERDRLGAIPHNPLPQTKYDMKLNAPAGRPVFIGPHVLLPRDKARHVGEAVAMVVAESRAAAQDAAELVAMEYAELPCVLDSRTAALPDAPRLWDDVPDNVFIDTWFGNREATDRVFASADHIVKASFHAQRVTAVAMEPRAALADFDRATGQYTLYAGSGGAVRQKRELAQVLAIDPQKLRVLSYDVGGNFGSRNRVFVEFGLVLWAAGKLGRPVKYTAARSESFISDYQGRDLVTDVELALGADGKFLAMRASNLSNAGARCVSLSPLGKGSGLITGSYDIPVASLRSRAVFTNTMPTQAYRSSGRPEVTYAIERLIELAAVQIKMDPIELRRRNLVSPAQMPYMNPVGSRYDSGTYDANMALAMRTADWEGFAARQAAAKNRGRLLGRGLANYVESSIGAPRERAEMEVLPTGRVRVVIGTQPSGQGHETSFAQVVASLLGVPIDAVDIVMGDTDIVSVGGGSHSGRSMRHAATVMSIGARDLLAQGYVLAAALFEVAGADVEFKDGAFRVVGTDRQIGVLDLARDIARRDANVRLATIADNEMHDPVFPNGCAICECEIDPETGAVTLTRYAAVDDVGRCINPMIVHGQTHGGIAQGVGQALWEQCFVDPESGQPLCGSLMDYALPRADQLPMFDTEIVEVLSPTNPFGIKAGGEGGTTPALAAVVNAIVNALAPFGVRDLPMPVTSDSIWRAIHGGSPETEQKYRIGRQ